MKRAQFLPLPLGAALIGAGPAAPTTLNVGSAANDEVTPVLYAQSSGMFHDAGLDVELHVISNGTAVATAAVAGAIDLGRGSLFSLITAHARGVPLMIVAGSAVTTADVATVGLLVPADGPIRSGADFNGKTVSTAALNDIMVVAVDAWVDKHGGDSKTVKYVELTGPAVGAALEAGRIDVAAAVNPTRAQILASGKYRDLGDPGQAIATRFLSSAWFGNADFVKKNAPAVKAFAQVLTKSSVYCNGHPTQTAPLIAKLSGVDVDTIEHMTRSRYATALDPRDIQPLIDAAAKYGIIAKSFDARDMIAVY